MNRFWLWSAWIFACLLVAGFGGRDLHGAALIAAVSGGLVLWLHWLTCESE